MFSFFKSAHIKAAAQTIAEQSTLSGPFVVMNSLAAIIACYGLLADSASGVIGAMIVASLISPLNGVALSLVRGDMRLLRTAMGTLGVGAALVYGLAFAIGLLHRDIPVSGEMLARTTPTVLDLVIAFASGVAGTIAMVSPRFNPAIVGVAVSTALVPPLCCSAMFAARGEGGHALHSGLLSLTNMVAIQLAASFVLWGGGAASGRDATQRHGAVLLRHALSFAGTAALGGVLIAQLGKMLEQQSHLAEVRRSLELSLGEEADARLIDVRLSSHEGESVVTAVVRSRGAIGTEAVERAALELPADRHGGRPSLIVRRVPVDVVASRGTSADAIAAGDAEE